MGDADALEHRAAAALAGEDQPHRVGMAPTHLGKQFGSFHAGHARVGDDHVERR